MDHSINVCIRGKMTLVKNALWLKKQEKIIPGNNLHTKARQLQRQWGSHQEICSRPKEEARKVPAVI